MRNRFLIFLLICVLFISGCYKERADNNWVTSDYTGTYKNVAFTESLIKEFSPGIYKESDIPDDIKTLTHGRIEINFRYDGGALISFMPLFYYGSINKNNNDDAVEEPQFNLAIEIGHYNVIPYRLEYLFYTISTYRQPQYCRDTYWPVISGENYTLIIDKKPEGMILQLRQGDNIINIFPHAFFPDSSQMFFNDISSYIDVNKGDSLKKVLMIGKGFAGFDKGLHHFNGLVSSVKIFKYSITDSHPEFEIQRIRNQHTQNQQVSYSLKDNLYGNDRFIIMKHEFWPYKFESGVLIPNGEMQTVESEKTANNRSITWQIVSKDIGFYKIYLQTINNEGDTLGSTIKPFELWIYPKEWDFEFYKN